MSPGRVLRVLLVAFACASALAMAGTLQAGGASSSVNVTFQVASTTSIGAGGCATGSAATSFGSVLPGARLVSGADCTVTFGSSNDTSRLRISQSDRRGRAMWRGTGRGTQLDPGFGTNGALTANLGSGTFDASGGIAMQPDGAVVISGGVDNANRDGVVARYTPTGAPDTSFGCATPPCSGKFMFNHPANSWDELHNLALQPDGKIVAVGYAHTGTTIQDFLVLRLNANGTLDTTFGCATPPCSGYATRNVSPSNRSDWAYAVRLQPDGKIVVAGGSKNAADTTWESTILRFHANGTRDSGFGSDGAFMYDYSGNGFYNEFWGLRVTADGSIYATGAASGTNAGAVVVRFTPAGALDSTFGCASPPCSGFRRIAPALMNDVSDVHVLASGSVLLAGSSNLNSGDATLGRLLPNGTFDTTFDGDGVLPMPQSLSSADGFGAIVPEPDGRFLVVGTVVLAANRDVSVVRVDSSGVRDTSVGSDGMLTFGVGTGNDRLTGTAAGHDGKVAVAVTATQANNDHGIAVIDGLTIGDYAATGNSWSSASNLFGACLRSRSGVTPSWTLDVDATCSDVDTDPWNAIPASSSAPAANVASAATGSTTGSVGLRFGVKLADSQSPGTYVAPVTFEVVAPA